MSTRIWTRGARATWRDSSRCGRSSTPCSDSARPGAILHWFTSPAVTAAIAGVTGLASGAFIGAAFRYIKRSGAGTALGERSLAGLTGEVTMEIAPDSAGTVKVSRGERRFRVRARMDATCPDDLPLRAGQSVVVVRMTAGIADVVPVDPEDMKLLEE